jgi:hypothetical protein
MRVKMTYVICLQLPIVQMHSASGDFMYLETKWVTSSISGLEAAASVSGRCRQARLKSLRSPAAGTGRERARKTNLF